MHFVDPDKQTFKEQQERQQKRPKINKRNSF